MHASPWYARRMVFWDTIALRLGTLAWLALVSAHDLPTPASASPEATASARHRDLLRGQVCIAHRSGGLSHLTTGIQFGASVAGLGDLDGDGIGDLAVGAPFDSQLRAGPGAVWILLLRRDGTVRELNRISSHSPALNGGLNQNDRFGQRVAMIGDVDGDGFADLAVQSAGDDGFVEAGGAIWILFLDQTGRARRATKILPPDPRPFGSPPALDFGEGIEALGDLDGDGRPEIAIGQSQLARGDPHSGGVWILELDRSGKVVDSKLWAEGSSGFSGPTPRHHNFGSSIAVLGDIDANGTTEVAVGAAFDDEVIENSGAIWILSVDDEHRVVDQRKIAAHHPVFGGSIHYDDAVGHEIASLPDLDGDGVPEVALSSGSDDQHGYDRGSVRVLFLDATGEPRRVERVTQGSAGFSAALNDGEWFGAGVCAVGDLDGDGVSEIAVGAPGHAAGGESTGAVWILFVDTAHFGDPTDPDPQLHPMDDRSRWFDDLGLIDRGLPTARVRRLREW